MISPSDRINAVNLINVSRDLLRTPNRGVQKHGYHDCTYRRWTAEDGVRADVRPESVRPSPPQKFNEEETKRVLEVCYDLQYANMPPGQIVPISADKGDYVGLESTIYRRLHGHRDAYVIIWPKISALRAGQVKPVDSGFLRIPSTAFTIRGLIG